MYKFCRFFQFLFLSQKVSEGQSQIEGKIYLILLICPRTKGAPFYRSGLPNHVAGELQYIGFCASPNVVHLVKTASWFIRWIRLVTTGVGAKTYRMTTLQEQD